MKRFEVSIRVYGLGGNHVRPVTVEARTKKSALNKVGKILGNQTFEVVEIAKSEIPKTWPR